MTFLFCAHSSSHLFSNSSLYEYEIRYLKGPLILRSDLTTLLRSSNFAAIGCHSFPYYQIFHGNKSSSGKRSVPSSPPFQRTSLSTTGSKPTPTKSWFSIPSTQPLCSLFPASSGQTPYQSFSQRPNPLFASPASNDFKGVISPGGLIPIKRMLRDDSGLESSWPLMLAWPSPRAGKWHSRKRLLLNSCDMTVICCGYEPVSRRKWRSENSTFW